MSFIVEISQLTQKTNQFNLTTKRYSEEEIKSILDSKKFIVKTIQIEDRFGDYGISGVAIIKITNDLWDIDTFLMSCRVIGKKVEFSFINEIISEAKQKGINKINAKFTQTEKNIPAKNFLKDVGFKLIKEESNIKYYSLKL